MASRYLRNVSMHAILSTQPRAKTLLEVVWKTTARYNKTLQNSLATYKHKDEVSFGVLPMMAEVLKLKDTSMLSLEITGLVKKHPSIRMEQLVNLMLCRGDMSRSEARQMVLDTLGEEEAMKPRPPGIFTEIANETK